MGRFKRIVEMAKSFTSVVRHHEDLAEAKKPDVMAYEDAPVQDDDVRFDDVDGYNEDFDLGDFFMSGHPYKFL